MDTPDPRNEKVLGRILTLTDGVVAIAILLLLIDIRLPSGTTLDNLGSALTSLWPNYLSFFISFIVIGLYWSAHVRLFREIIRYNWLLIWLNLLYLLIIVLIPFSTTVFSMYPVRLSLIIYASIVAFAGYMNTIIRIYATQGYRLTSKNYTVSHIRIGIILSLVAPLGFTISIGIAFINELVAQIFWVVIAVIHIVFQRFLKT